MNYRLPITDNHSSAVLISPGHLLCAMTTQNTTLFISDLHLDSQEPRIINTFFYFLEHIAPEANALYILGDFFESYVGDDDQNELTKNIITALSKLTDKGVPTFLMHGNRDFLIGDDFAKQSGITLIPDPSSVTLYDKSVLLMHGDSLCTSDKSHQRFRKIIHNAFFQKLFLLLPLARRKKIADQLRQKSKQGNRYKTAEIMDVSENAIIDTLKKYQADLIIHGHTHRPMISKNRIVLDAWHDQGNYLRIDENWHTELINIAH